MSQIQVKKVVAVCFLEAVKLTLEHLGAHRLELSEKGTLAPADLTRIYGDVRRLRDYLQRCVGGYGDQVDLDIAPGDIAVLVACCRRSVDALELRLAEANLPPDEREWLGKKQQVLGHWALELADKPLEEIVHHAEGAGNKGLFNNAAQSWNHAFYWNSLSPEKTAPEGDLLAAITRDFGSLDDLKKKLKETAVNHFASGWAWLVSRDGTLSVTETHDAGTELTLGIKPLVVIDVWEHAYYIDRKNLRPAYVDAVVDELLNWDFAAENFARETTWTYPA